MAEKQTLDQRRADHAWKAVIALKESFQGHEKERAQFATELRRFPVRVMNAGLVPALAYLAAKGKATEIEEVLKQWMQLRYPADRDATLRTRALANAMELRLYTAETLAYVQWFTRFAEAEGLLKKSDVQDQGE